MIIRFVALLLLFTTVSSYRLFLIGGNTDDTSPLVYQGLANTVPNRPPQPGKCSSDWNDTQCPRIAVATSAAYDQQAGNSAYSDNTQSLSYSSLFLKFGMSPKHLTIHRDNYHIHGNVSTPEGAVNLEILQQADIIFFNGGDQSRHVRTWLNDSGHHSPLLVIVHQRASKNQVVLSGTSAGSMIFGPMTVGGGDSFGTLYFQNSVGVAPKQITDADMGGSGFADIRQGNKSLQYYNNAGKMKGFNFVNWFADTHFHARGRLGRLPPILKDIKLALGVGIDEKTAFLYEENKVSQVIGYNGVTIVDMEKAFLPPQSFFTANNIRVHYLTAGDSYDFSTKKVASCKEAISSPYYSGPTDSSAILSSYQASLLITRQIDQRAIYNLGKTRTPSDFSKDTPIFELFFMRDNTTRGYYSDHKYTAVNVVLSFAFGGNSQSNLSSE